MNLITQYGLHRLVLVLGYIWVRVGFILQNLAPPYRYIYMWLESAKPCLRTNAGCVESEGEGGVCF